MKKSDYDQSEWMSTLNELRQVIDGIGSILRFLWTTNLAAAIAGIIVHQYIGAAIAGVSSIASLLGAAATRKATKSINGAIAKCGKNLVSR